MALYKYDHDLDPTDRFDHLSILLDNGSTLVMQKGLTYNLSLAEYRRASQYIVLVPSTGTPQPTPGGGGGGGAVLLTTLGVDEEPSLAYADGTLWIEVLP